MTGKPSERRKHGRYDVDQPCRVTIGHGPFRGRGGIDSVIANISMGGVAIRFGLLMANPPSVGTPVNLYIGGVGDFPGKVMRCYDGGFAIAFRPLKTWDKQLVEKLERLLPDESDEA